MTRALRLPPSPPKKDPAPLEGWYLRCLKMWWERYGAAPTLRDLADWTRKSQSSVYRALTALEGKGHVRRDSRGKFEVI